MKENKTEVKNEEIKDVEVNEVVENNIDIDVKAYKRAQIWSGVKKWGGRAGLVLLGAVGAALLLGGDSDDDEWEDDDSDDDIYEAVEGTETE